MAVDFSGLLNAFMQVLPALVKTLGQVISGLSSYDNGLANSASKLASTNEQAAKDAQTTFRRDLEDKVRSAELKDNQESRDRAFGTDGNSGLVGDITNLTGQLGHDGKNLTLSAIPAGTLDRTRESKVNALVAKAAKEGLSPAENQERDTLLAAAYDKLSGSDNPLITSGALGPEGKVDVTKLQGALLDNTFNSNQTALLNKFLQTGAALNRKYKELSELTLNSIQNTSVGAAQALTREATLDDRPRDSFGNLTAGATLNTSDTSWTAYRDAAGQQRGPRTAPPADPYGSRSISNA
jgi:hypothetical protein